MESFRPLSTSAQLAEHLRRQIHSGALSGTLPGVQQLVRSLGVNSVAVGKAIQQLEREGLVIHQGARRSRLIANRSSSKSASLKVGMLYYDAGNALKYDALCINQELFNAGHTVVVASKSMMEMGMDVAKTARLVKSIDVDAWVIYAGSQKILEWFDRQKKPAFALHGRHNSVSLASFGIRKTAVISTLIAKLVDMGHSRIVLLAREERRKPHLGLVEQSFIEDLEFHGIKTGAYNIPDWQDSPEGLRNILHSLFQYTRPTALIVGDSQLFHAVQVHLANQGLQAPKDLSLFCNDFEESFKWLLTGISHIHWDYRPCIRRIVQWSNNIGMGQDDRKKTLVKAILYEGGTIGSAPQVS